MKKRISIIILAMLLVFTIVLPTSAEVLPSERLLPRLVDDADILSDSEETELLAKLDEISERQECDVVVVTVGTLQGRTATEYADDYFDYNGFGIGDAHDGIILLISMEDRDWAISTCGYGITAFTDAGQEYIVDKFKPYLSDGDYADAFTTFAEQCDKFIMQANTGKPYDSSNLPKEPVSIFGLFAAIVIGYVIAFAWGRKKKGSLKSVKNQEGAANYAASGLVLSINNDQFLRKNVTTRHIVRETNTTKPTGSSTHVSSSGRTHGGSSGKF